MDQLLRTWQSSEASFITKATDPAKIKPSRCVGKLGKNVDTSVRSYVVSVFRVKGTYLPILSLFLQAKVLQFCVFNYWLFKYFLPIEVLKASVAYFDAVPFV